MLLLALQAVHTYILYMCVYIYTHTHPHNLSIMCLVLSPRSGQDRWQHASATPLPLEAISLTLGGVQVFGSGRRPVGLWGSFCS